MPSHTLERETIIWVLEWEVPTVEQIIAHPGLMDPKQVHPLGHTTTIVIGICHIGLSQTSQTVSYRVHPYTFNVIQIMNYHCAQ